MSMTVWAINRLISDKSLILSWKTHEIKPFKDDRGLSFRVKASRYQGILRIKCNHSLSSTADPMQ